MKNYACIVSPLVLIHCSYFVKVLPVLTVHIDPVGLKAATRGFADANAVRGLCSDEWKALLRHLILPALPMDGINFDFKRSTGRSFVYAGDIPLWQAKLRPYAPLSRVSIKVLKRPSHFKLCWTCRV